MYKRKNSIWDGIVIRDNMLFQKGADSSFDYRTLQLLGGKLIAVNIPSPNKKWEANSSSVITLKAATQQILTLSIDEDIDSRNGSFIFIARVDNTNRRSRELTIELLVNGTVVHSETHTLLGEETGESFILSAFNDNDLQSGDTISVNMNGDTDNDLQVRGDVVVTHLKVEKAVDTAAFLAALLESNPNVKTARIGDDTGEVYIDKYGILLKGGAIVYDDLFGNALDFDSGGWLGANIEKNLNDGTVDFHANGDITDSGKRAAFNVQLKHKMVEGANSFFRMHCHWFQSDTTERTLTVQYRKIKKPANPGDAGVPISAWSTAQTVTMNAANNFFTYSSGTIHQVTEFPEIDISDMHISDIIQFRIAREDSLSGDLQTLYFDAHIAIDSEGSRWKWVKY